MDVKTEVIASGEKRGKKVKEITLSLQSSNVYVQVT